MTKKKRKKKFSEKARSTDPLDALIASDTMFVLDKKDFEEFFRHASGAEEVERRRRAEE